jgi:glycosyltransferase involved in cell wall biosynthesis
VKILFLVRDLEFRGGAKQLSLLAAGLPRARFEVSIGMLIGNGPFSKPLRTSGVRVEAVGWNRLVDLRPLWRLRSLVHDFRPDLIHCWDLCALRGLALVNFATQCPVMVSLPSANQYFRSPKDFGSISPFDQWLLQKTVRRVVQSQAEYDRWQAKGIMAVVPYGVEPFDDPGQDRAEVCRALALPANARWLLCVGPLEIHKGFKDAIWAFNILGYLYPDLHLIIVGDGPDRDRLERLATTYFPERVLVTGRLDDLRGLLSHAEAVWIPSHRPGGINVALEAMAAAIPVVASNLPALAEVIVNGETGILLPAGDKMGFARQTRRLLENADLRSRLGQAGRRRVKSHYSVEQLVQRFVELYESIVAIRPLAA